MVNQAVDPGSPVHPAWGPPAAGPVARALSHLVLEAAALLRELGDPAAPAAADRHRRQAARLLRLAEVVAGAAGPEPSAPPPTAPDATRLRLQVERVLSPREREVLVLLALGLTDREVADRLGISRRTATTHSGHVLGKLKRPNRAAAASLAVKAGLA